MTNRETDCKKGDSMNDSGKDHRLDPDQLDTVTGGSPLLGVYSPDFRHKRESLQFFRTCVGDEVYRRAMDSEAGRAHHYAVVRAFLNKEDWEKFVWIEEFGSLNGFPGH